MQKKVYKTRIIFRFKKRIKKRENKKKYKSKIYMNFISSLGEEKIKQKFLTRNSRRRHLHC